MNFEFHLSRLVSGYESCGCNYISETHTITSSDFGTNDNTVTKQYTVTVTAGAGNSASGPTLRSNDHIIFSLGSWAPSKKYGVTVTDAPLSNNSITPSGSISDSGNPSIFHGSAPTGGNGTLTYQWQSSTTSASTGFTDILGATAQSYDPPAIQFTTYYRRNVSSGAATSTSNVIKITIVRTGATFDNPILMGDLGICSSYGSTLAISPNYGYGNDFGNSYDDIIYKFNLTTQAKLSLMPVPGLHNSIYLLDATRNKLWGIPVEEYPEFESSGEVHYNLQPGVYYFVTEPTDSQDWAGFQISVMRLIWTSPDVTIPAGSSTTLTAYGGAESYTWSTGLNPSITTGGTLTVSPAVTTSYSVTTACSEYKTITVSVTGAVGSTINDPIIANTGGCIYYSPTPHSAGYGDDYGEPGADIFYKFTLANAAPVGFDSQGEVPMRLVLLNSSGDFIAEKRYDWVDTGDDAGTRLFGSVDGTYFRASLQAGTYYLVADGTYGNGNGLMGVVISNSSACRIATEAEFENKNTQLNKVVYPTPASHSISFNLEQDGPALINIVNTNGVTVKEASITGKADGLSISELPTGLYLIKIIQQNKIYREKMLIER